MTKEKIFQEIKEALYMHHGQDIHITTIDHIEQILTKHLQDTEEREVEKCKCPICNNNKGFEKDGRCKNCGIFPNPKFL